MQGRPLALSGWAFGQAGLALMDPKRPLKLRLNGAPESYLGHPPERNLSLGDLHYRYE